jgi:uncharacterized protein YjiS (DUF1127 family)
MRIVDTDGRGANKPSVAGWDGVLRLLRGMAGLACRAAMQFAVWRRKTRDRRILSSLSDRELSDMGITRCDIPSIVAGTLVRAGWLGEISMMVNANLPTPSNDTAPSLGVPRRGRSV